MDKGKEGNEVGEVTEKHHWDSGLHYDSCQGAALTGSIPHNVSVKNKIC